MLRSDTIVSMEIYLLRHGIAEDGAPGSPDSDRRLTPEGKRKLHETLKAAAQAGVQPSLILSSPYVRARQTAEIAAGELGYKEEIVTVGALTPDGHPEDVWDEIRTHARERAILLASHEPLCSRMAAFLLGAPELQVDFKKGALMRIDVSPGRLAPQGVLNWMLTAKLAGS